MNDELHTVCPHLCSFQFSAFTQQLLYEDGRAFAFGMFKGNNFQVTSSFLTCDVETVSVQTQSGCSVFQTPASFIQVFTKLEVQITEQSTFYSKKETLELSMKA